MKKKCGIFLLVILFQQSVFGLYTGNPSSPSVMDKGLFFSNDSWFGVGLTAQFDILSDKSLRPTNRNVQKMDSMEYLMELAGLRFDFFERFEFYGLLGAQKFNFDIRVDKEVRHEIETSNDLAWEIGIKALVYNQGAFSVGFELEYETAHPNIHKQVENGAPFGSAAGAKLRYQEWQFSLGASYEIGFMVPYLAYCYSHPLINFKNFSPEYLPSGKTRFAAKGRKKSGGAIGATIRAKEICSVTFEVRFIDETALTFAGDFKF